MDAGSLVATFARTHDAFAFEDAARAAGVPGRLIPLPTAIAATCGLAWLTAEASGLLAHLTTHQLVELVETTHPLRHEGVYRYDGAGYVRVDA